MSEKSKDESKNMPLKKKANESYTYSDSDDDFLDAGITDDESDSKNDSIVDEEQCGTVEKSQIDEQDFLLGQSEQRLKIFAAKKLVNKAKSPRNLKRYLSNTLIRNTPVDKKQKIIDQNEETTTKESNVADEKKSSDGSNTVKIAGITFKRIVLEPKSIDQMKKTISMSSKNVSNKLTLNSKDVGRIFSSRELTIKRTTPSTSTNIPSEKVDCTEKDENPELQFQAAHQPYFQFIGCESVDKETSRKENEITIAKSNEQSNFPKAIYYPLSNVKKPNEESPKNVTKLSYLKVFEKATGSKVDGKKKNENEILTKDALQATTEAASSSIEKAVSIKSNGNEMIKKFHYTISQNMLASENDKIMKLESKPKSTATSSSSSNVIQEPFSRLDIFDKNENNEVDAKNCDSNISSNLILIARPQVNIDLIETLANYRVISRYLFRILNIPNFDFDDSSDLINMYKIMRK
jgi:hypothetical protein